MIRLYIYVFVTGLNKNLQKSVNMDVTPLKNKNLCTTYYLQRPSEREMNDELRGDTSLFLVLLVRLKNKSLR